MRVIDMVRISLSTRYYFHVAMQLVSVAVAMALHHYQRNGSDYDVIMDAHAW